MMRWVIFHHNDMDGRCAGAIAYRWVLATNRTPADLVEVDYNRAFPVKRVEAGDKIVIVDFSPTPCVMTELLDRAPGGIIWIDHHRTAAAYGYGSDFEGLRDFREGAPAACQLSWTYFHPNQPTPCGVDLISDLDTWRLSRAPACFHFHEGLRLHDTSPVSPVWDDVLSGDAGFMTMTLSRGETGCDYQAAYCRDLCEQSGFETVMAGYKAFACNMSRFGARGFGERLGRYPICISYSHDGTRFSVTLYTSSPALDVSAICKQYGGGGHKGAAGFVCRELPFAPISPATVQNH